jgi:hypothetical protein
MIINNVNLKDCFMIYNTKYKIYQLMPVKYFNRFGLFNI